MVQTIGFYILRLTAQVITPLIRYDNAKAFLGKERDLRLPSIPELRKTMQKDNVIALTFTRFYGMQGNAIYLMVMVFCIHNLFSIVIIRKIMPLFYHHHSLP